jgi:N-alpha-acetyltransferase 35, NatC auxiliary subunit
MQTVFHHGNRVLIGFPPSWIVDRFFIESVGVSYERISTMIKDSWVGKDEPPLALFESRIIKVRFISLYNIEQLDSFSQLVKDHVTSSWYNLPRRRRHLMNITSDWHVLHDLFLRLLEFTMAPVSILSSFVPITFTYVISHPEIPIFSDFYLVSLCCGVYRPS